MHINKVSLEQAAIHQFYRKVLKNPSPFSILHSPFSIHSHAQYNRQNQNSISIQTLSRVRLANQVRRKKKIVVSDLGEKRMSVIFIFHQFLTNLTIFVKSKGDVTRIFCFFSLFLIYFVIQTRKRIQFFTISYQFSRNPSNQTECKTNTS